MRYLVAFLMIATVFAGCASEPVDSDDPLPFVASTEMPSLDAVAMLADLKSFVEAHGERAGNTAAHLASRDTLESRYEAAGLEVWRQSFNNGIDQENIAGIKWGQHADQWVVVGGHYDVASKECGLVGQCILRPYTQGAYDDGSGTLQTIHLAEAYAQLNTTYTIVFVNFDGEERGLQGSQAFFEEVFSGDSPYGNVTIRAMLDLDMFGINWPGTDAPVYFDTNSIELRNATHEAMHHLNMPEDMLEFRGISLGRSDYKWFMENGIPTGFFISSFEEWELPANAGYNVNNPGTGTAADVASAYPFWHLEDTYETMVQMAGSQEDLEAGFQLALDLANHVVWRMAMDDAPLSGEAR